MKRKSVAHSTGVVGSLDVTKKRVGKGAVSNAPAEPKPQGSDYREFLDYKAHAYWALCESQQREARARQLQERRLAKKGIALADVHPPGVAALAAGGEGGSGSQTERGD